MPKEKKYSIWPALLIIVVAFGIPIAIGTLEIHIARNAHAEAAALQQLDAIAKAETTYEAAHHSFSPTLADLPGLPHPEASYRYDYRQIDPQSYAVTAEPTDPGKHGKRYFYADQSGVVRYEMMHPASAGSPVVPSAKEEKK